MFIRNLYLCFRPEESQRSTRQDSAIMSSKDKELLKLFIKNLNSWEFVNPGSTCMMEGNIILNPVGEKTRSITSLQGKIVPTIGKCIGIMGGRIQFAPTIILKIL